MRVYLSMLRTGGSVTVGSCMVAGLLLWGLSAKAQSVPQPTPTLRAQSTLVEVPALVRTRAGEVVFTLTADDFVLTDDGIPQRLRLEEETPGEPLALVVVLEAGAASARAGWHPLERRAVDRFVTLPTMIDALAGERPHRVAVVGFDSAPELLQGFTGDGEAVARAIHGFSDSDGDRGAAILDSVGFAVDLLRRWPPEVRRAILLVSETEDRGSKLSLEGALRAVGDTNTVIYSVSYSTALTAASRYGSRELPTKRIAPVGTLPGSAPAFGVYPPGSKEAGMVAAFAAALTTGIALGNPDPYPPGGCMSLEGAPADVAAESRVSRLYDCLGQVAPPLALARMASIAAIGGLRRNTPETVARLTGGEYFAFNDAGSLERDLHAIGNHLGNRYLLSFQPQAPHPGFHALRLTLRDGREGVVVARTGYWAEANR